MTTIVDELVYRVGFDFDKNNLLKLDDGFKSLTKVALGLAAAAGGAAAGVFALTNRVATQLDDMDEFAQSVGISTQELQKLQFVGERLGVGTEGINTSLRFMVKNLAEASAGTGTAIDALDSLGITVEQLRGLAPEQQLKMISNAMANVSDGGQRVSIAMDIFGRSGASMVTVLKDGAPAIDAIAARMVNLVPDETIENASLFKDSMQEFNDVIGAIGTTIAGEIMPIMREMVAQFREFFIQNRAIIQSGLRAFLVSVYFVLRTLFEIVKTVVNIFMFFIDALGGTQQTLNLLKAVLILISPILLGIAARWAAMMAVMAVGRIFAIIDALKTMRIWLLLTSITLRGLLIATGIGALLLALQDLFSWVNGQPSLLGLLFGDFATVWPKLQKMFADIKAWFLSIGDSAVFKFLAGTAPGSAPAGGGRAAGMGVQQRPGNRTVNNNATTNNTVSITGTNPEGLGAALNNHLEKTANTALVTSNTGRQ